MRWKDDNNVIAKTNVERDFKSVNDREAYAFAKKWIKDNEHKWYPNCDAGCQFILSTFNLKVMQWGRLPNNIKVDGFIEEKTTH